jgi:hypothetical protein
MELAATFAKKQIKCRSIKPSTGHDQRVGTDPALLVDLVELATGSSPAPATITTKAMKPARLRWWSWWSWPHHRARRRPRHQQQLRPGRRHRPGFAGRAGHRIEHGTGQDTGHDHDQGDSTGAGPALLHVLAYSHCMLNGNCLLKIDRKSIVDLLQISCNLIVDLSQIYRNFP